MLPRSVEISRAIEILSRHKYTVRPALADNVEDAPEECGVFVILGGSNETVQSVIARAVIDPWLRTEMQATLGDTKIIPVKPLAVGFRSLEVKPRESAGDHHARLRAEQQSIAQQFGPNVA